MHIQANVVLNPKRYYLSPEASKRLRWMYLIHYECDGNISLAANKIGVSRTWLSLIHSQWKDHNRDPRSLEPKSKAPKKTNNRKRIDVEIELNIVKQRTEYPYLGKVKIAKILDRDFKMIVGETTVNRYLHKHGLINPKLSEKNRRAWQNKKDTVQMKQKIRPPLAIKDYKPGALMEKDMKYVFKLASFRSPSKYKVKENFWYQHTLEDSFTRFRVLGLAPDADSKTAVAVQLQTMQRLPFQIATMNTDNGGENEKDFDNYLTEKGIVHFNSRTGTPTDNPRVERSHLTDEIEFYNQTKTMRNFEDQEEALKKWEYTYNFIRPHQALGYLTPMEFYQLWKKNPAKAYAIKDKYKKTLARQANRLRIARRMKSKEKIEILMQFIDKKLSKRTIHKC